MLGYEAEAKRVSMKELACYIHPEGLGRPGEDFFENYVSSCGHGPYELELRLRRNDGSWCWILSKARAVERDEKGIPTRIIVLDINIQNLKDARVSQDDLAPGEYAMLAVRDDGCGYGRGDPGACLRTLFHDQGNGGRHGNGSGDRLRESSGRTVEASTFKAIREKARPFGLYIPLNRVESTDEQDAKVKKSSLQPGRNRPSSSKTTPIFWK